VIDWIVLWFIPTFNIADSAITFGTAILVAVALFGSRDG
jgi:lipoprotein signal peptidase